MGKGLLLTSKLTVAVDLLAGSEAKERLPWDNGHHQRLKLPCMYTKI